MPYTLQGENSNGSNVNQAPIALGEVVTVVKNTALRFPLASFDADGTVSAPVITQQPANGTVTVISVNVIEYTPNTDYIGVDEFKFEVTDDESATSPDAAININVIEIRSQALRASVFPDANIEDRVIIENHADDQIPDDEYLSFGEIPNRYWEQNQ